MSNRVLRPFCLVNYSSISIFRFGPPCGCENFVTGMRQDHLIYTPALVYTPRECPLKTIRILALCGIAGPIFFTVVVLILGSLRPGYSHLTQAISELGETGAPNAIFQQVNFLMIGALVLAFSLGLHRGIGQGKGSKVGPVLLGIFALLSGVGNSIFPCDPGCEFVTFTGTMHNVTGLLGFLAFVAAALVLSRRYMTDGMWRGYRSYSIVSGILVLLFLFAFIAASAGAVPFRGVFQRTFVGLMFLWLIVTGVRLYKVAGLQPR